MRVILTSVALTVILSPLGAQQVAVGDLPRQEWQESNDRYTAMLPDAPRANVPSTAVTSTQQDKRILGIIPNFRAVSADTVLPPQTSKEKFKTGLEDSFDYSSFIFAGLQAGAAQATKSYPVFRQGAAGYGRYYWHTLADQTHENLLVESILPAVLHEDSRYYVLGRGKFLKRVGYALSRPVITRTDGGEETFNAAEVFGSGAAAGISSAYYPGVYRTWTKTGQRWLTNVVLDSATFVTKEFWPDIDRSVFRHKD